MNLYENCQIRMADSTDVPAILALTQSARRCGSLLNRRRTQLQREIEYFRVCDYRGEIVSCTALHHWGDCVELACVATHPACRGRGFGSHLILHCLEYLERGGLASAFVLTRSAQHWFVSLGFTPTGSDWLPVPRRAAMDSARHSQVMVQEFPQIAVCA